MEGHVPSAVGLAKLQKADAIFLELFKHGSLSVEIYKPDGIDNQQPHEQDEIYVIISGSGTFLNNSQRTTFTAGDFLFVKAGVEHKFEDFSTDFATWVFFYGPNGGEKE